MSSSNGASSGPQMPKIRALAAVLILSTCLTPFAVLYQADHGSFFTNESTMLLALSFAVHLIIFVTIAAVWHRKSRRNAAVLLTVMSLAFGALFNERASARPCEADRGDDCVPVGTTPTPTPVPTPTRVPNKRPAPRPGFPDYRKYAVSITSGRGQRWTADKGGALAGEWVGGAADNGASVFQNQLFVLIDRDAGVLLSGDSIQLETYTTRRTLEAVKDSGMLPTNNYRSSRALFTIHNARGTGTAIHPDDIVWFETSEGQAVKFIDAVIGQQQVCTEPNPDSDNRTSRVCRTEDVRGGFLTYGLRRDNESDYKFKLGYAFDSKQFALRERWIEREWMLNPYKYDLYVNALYDHTMSDQFFSETSAFELDLGRTYHDAMVASSEGMQYGAALGTVTGACFGNPIIGAGFGGVVVGTFSTAVGAARSVLAQKKEWAEKASKERQAEWTAARKREIENPDFVGPPRPEKIPGGGEGSDEPSSAPTLAPAGEQATEA